MIYYFFFCSPRMKSELDAVSDQGQHLIRRYGNLRDMLIQDENIVIIDDYICLQSDTDLARRLALSQLIEKTEDLALNLPPALVPASTTSTSRPSRLW